MIINRNKQTSDILLKKMYSKTMKQQMIAGLVLSLNMIIDCSLTGRFLGADAMSAMGLYSPLSNIIFLCFVFITGAQIMCGNSIGRGKSDETISYFSTCFAVLLTLGSICLCIMLFLSPLLATILGASGDIHIMLQNYLIGMSFGIPFSMIYSLTISFLALNNRFKLSNISLSVMIIANLFLDILLVLVFGLGMFGMGLASSISSLLACIVAMLGILKSNKNTAIHLNFSKLNPKCILDMIKFGSTQFTFNITIALRTYLLNLIIVFYVGQQAVAVMAVLGIASGLLGTISSGASNATLMLGSIFYGEKNENAICRLVKIALSNSLLISIFVIIAVNLLSGLISQIFFVNSTTAYFMTKQMLQLYVFITIFSCINNILIKVYQAQNHIIISNVFCIINNIVTIIVAFVLVNLLGSVGIWLAMPLAEAICFLVPLLYAWKQIKHFPQNIAQWCCIDKSISESSKYTFFATVDSIESSIDASKQLISFCIEQGASKRNAYMAGLSMEELTCNVIENINNSMNNVVMDVFVYCHNDQIRMQIKDNGKDFNPIKYMQQFSNNDKISNIGLKIVAKIAKVMNYEQLIGMNIVTIEL